jgi:hypothetical protein
MLGQGPFPGVVDFGDADFCAGVVGVVGVFAVLDSVVVVLAALPAVELGAAAAPAMPETAPPVARAPATIVAPSILVMCMGWNLLGVDGLCLANHVARPG